MAFEPKVGRLLSQQEVQQMNSFSPSSGVPTGQPQPTQQQPRSSGLDKLSGAFNAIFKGGKIGETIGTGIAQGKFGDTVQKLVTGRDMSEEEEKGVKLDVTGKQLVGDVIGVATTVAPFTRAGSAALSAGGLLGRVGSGAALGAAMGTGQAMTDNANVGKGTLTGAAIGGAFPIATKGVSLVARFFGGTTKRIGAAVSGTGGDVIDEILKNPKAAQQGMRAESNVTLRAVTNDALTAVKAYQKQTSNIYKQALSGVPDVQLSKDGAVNYLGEKLKAFGIKSTVSDGKFKIVQSTLRPSEEKILQEVFKTVDAWDDLTPVGMNNLAVKIGNFRKVGDQSKALNSIIDSLKRNVRTYISAEIPALGEVNKQFGEREDFIRAVKATLSIKLSATGENAVQKTAGKIATLFNANKDLARELVENLEEMGQVDILGREAGRQMVAGESSRSTGKIGDLARSAIQAVIPPRAVGEVVAATGIAQQKLEPVLEAMAQLAPAERALLTRSLTDFFSQEQEQPPAEDTPQPL